MFRIRGRKALASVALGLLAILAIDRGVTAAARFVLSDLSDFRFSELYKGQVATRIAIFGNSRGVHSWYAPHLAAATCGSAYNFSFNGLTLPAIKVLIEDYLEMNPAPEFIILDLPKLHEPGSDMVLRTYASQSDELSDLVFDGRPIDRVASALIASRGWYSELFLRSLIYLRRSDQGWIIGSTTASGSLVDEWNSWSNRQKESYVGPFLSNEPEKISLLSEIAAMASEHGTTLITTIAPFLPAIANDPAFSTEALDHSIDVALPDSMNLDLSHFVDDEHLFADRLHMNKSGSIALIDELLAENLVPGLSQCK